jgi:hypothetical protein
LFIVGGLLFIAFIGHLATSRTETVVASSPKQTDNFTVDEAALLTAACGKPTYDRTSDARAYGGPNAVKRTIKYSSKNIELWFLKNSTNTPSWTWTGAFRMNSDDDLSMDEIHSALPCTGKLKFGLAFSDK